MKLNKKKYLVAAMLSICVGEAYAAGLERSPQQIDALFERGLMQKLAILIFHRMFKVKIPVVITCLIWLETFNH